MNIERLKELRRKLQFNSELEDEEIENMWELIDEAIARQSPTDEAVRDAIAWANHEHSRCMVNLFFGDADCASLAIKALQQMKPEQAVTDEDVKEEIAWQEKCLKSLKEDWERADEETRCEPDASSFYLRLVNSYQMVITALQQMQGWIPVSERLPTKEDANKKGDVLCRFSDGAVETWAWNEITEWNNNALRGDEGFDGITHWRSMLPEPKGRMTYDISI